MFEMLFWTGCRIGELLAVTKADINFEKNQLSINKTYHESGNTTIPEYLFIRDLPGRAGGDDGMNMNEKNKIENHRMENQQRKKNKSKNREMER